jgi:uncharacterized protein (DUF305 family)
MPMTTEPAVEPISSADDGEADAPAAHPGDGPPDGPEPEVSGGGGGGPLGGLGLGKVLVLAAALAFLVGAAGYFVGTRTAGPPTSAVDAGFLQDMSDHHDQAVELALLGNARATDPVVRDFATEVLLFQRRELGLFQAYQQERGITPAEYDPDRTTMAWMDMARPLSTMNGMATPEQIEALEAATGTEFDRQFLTLMQTHHIGGAHMAEYAAANAADPKIRTMADRMAKNQLAEADEYQGVLDRLGT